MEDIIYSTRVDFSPMDETWTIWIIDIHAPELVAAGLKSIELHYSPHYKHANAMLFSEDQHGLEYIDDFEYHLVRYNEDTGEHDAVFTVRPQLCPNIELTLSVEQQCNLIRVQLSQREHHDDTTQNDR